MYFIQEFPDSWSNEWEVYKVRKALWEFRIFSFVVANVI